MRHFELAIRTHGEHRGVLEMRKHLAWYLRGSRGAAAAKRELLKMVDYAQILEYIAKLNL
jgi:tRNA-dihydrouridine synthase